jgi:hypothetical protein
LSRLALISHTRALRTQLLFAIIVMDAHSVSFTSPAERQQSRIYQDLEACGLRRLVNIDQDQLRKSLMMASYEKVTEFPVSTYPSWEVASAAPTATVGQA